MREGKKFGKAVQAERKKERQQEKKAAIDSISRLRKQRQKSGYAGDVDFDVELEKLDKRNRAQPGERIPSGGCSLCDTPGSIGKVAVWTVAACANTQTALAEALLGLLLLSMLHVGRCAECLLVGKRCALQMVVLHLLQARSRSPRSGRPTTASTALAGASVWPSRTTPARRRMWTGSGRARPAAAGAEAGGVAAEGGAVAGDGAVGGAGLVVGARQMAAGEAAAAAVACAAASKRAAATAPAKPGGRRHLRPDNKLPAVRLSHRSGLMFFLLISCWRCKGGDSASLMRI